MSTSARKSSENYGLNVIPADDLDDAAQKIVNAVAPPPKTYALE